MRKTMRWSAALGALLATVFALSGCGSNSVGSDQVAVVAGNPISIQAYNHWLYVADKGNSLQSGGPVIVPTNPPSFPGCVRSIRALGATYAKTPVKQLRADCQQLFNQLNATVMDFLIKAYWYQGTAYKAGIRYTNADATKALAQARKQTFPTAAQYKQFLLETGETPQDIAFRLRVNTVFQKLIARETPKVTPAVIQRYYDQHKSEFGTPAARNVKLIQTTSQAKIQQAEKALKSGQSFASVAARYSTDTATKSTGGVINDLQNGQVEQAVNRVVFSAPLNRLQGPIHGTFGYYLVEVTKIIPGTTASLAKATPEIKAILAQTSGQSAQTKITNRAKRQWGAQTTCAKAYMMVDCAGYKAPKTATSPLGAGGAGGAGAAGSAGGAGAAGGSAGSASGSAGGGAASTVTQVPQGQTSASGGTATSSGTSTK